MRVGILYQEDPVVFGPFLRKTILARPQDVAVVIKAGVRDAGGHPKTWRAWAAYWSSLWLIWETRGFVKAQLKRAGLSRESGSVEELAHELGIPVLECTDPNDPGFRAQLAEHRLDVVFNQSERLLRRPVLEVPRLGFVNRHGSLLPSYRGRMGSFWAHAARRPVAGVTVHRIDEGLDSGPILARETVPVDPRWSYPRVLDELFARSPALVWLGIDRLADPTFTPLVNAGGERPFRVPKLADAFRYRLRLLRRRWLTVDSQL